MTKEKDYFRTFCKVSKAFGSTQSREQLLDLIVQSAMETMDGKAGSLFLSDEKKDVFVAVAHKGLSKSYHEKPLQAKRVVDIVLEKGYLAAKDATTDPRLEHHEAKKTEGIASLLAVPVKVGKKAIGILTLYTATPRGFSKEEIEFLSALAEQGGLAIQQARLLERIQKNSMLFLDLATNINATLDVKKILHNLTVDICEALGMKGAIIRLLNKESGNLHLVASHGLSDEFLNKGPVSAEKSVAQAMKGETIVIDDVKTDKRIQYHDEVMKEGIVSMLVVPIKVKDDVIGIMRLCSAVKRDYPEDIIVLVNALAQTGGLAIQNASLYMALEADMKGLKEDIWSHRSWF
ncbi:MAG: GAF domain-containing protein [Deltaproteobacteria bacterium]|nr:GAF domain-containing protein [Deltaproteobacteria bacterium]